MKTKVYGFALSFHLKKSRSHETLVVKPLSNWCNFAFTSWDGTNLSKLPSDSSILLFFQYPPPAHVMNNPRYKVVWIPMWDHIKKYPDSFWTTVPKSVRVIAFSEPVAKKSRANNLSTLRLQYYPNVKDNLKTDKNDKRVLFYWNRTGMIGRKELAKLCDILRVKTLYFQNQLDPGLIHTLNYRLPDILGNTSVVHLPNHLPDEDYKTILNRVNIYIAPRAYEGVGLSFVEALSRGCFVLGHNAPTMNEYITHTRDGFLFDLKEKYSLHSLISNAIAVRIPKLLGGRDFQNHLNVDWRALASEDISTMGENARERATAGNKLWNDSLEKYFDFVTSS